MTGAEGDAAEALARQVEVARHVRAVVLARAMTPAEQVRVLMMAAASVIVGNACGPRRDMAVAQAVVALTASVAGAGAAVDGLLADMPAEGRA